MLAGVLSSSGQAGKTSAGLDTGVGRWIMSDRLHIAHRNGKNCKKLPVLVVTDWHHSTFMTRFGAPVHLESCFYSVPCLIQWTYFKKHQQNEYLCTYFIKSILNCFPIDSHRRVRPNEGCWERNNYWIFQSWSGQWHQIFERFAIYYFETLSSN